MIKLALLFAFHFLAVLANPTPVTVKDLVNTTTCINCFKLNNGQYIPVVGLGTSRLGRSEADVIQAIKDAIDVGYRHIDTADFYKNEPAIGKALDELFKNGKVKREELFITTKVWSNHHTEELALKSIEKSLKDLKVDYVDLALVHWPMTFKSGEEYEPRGKYNNILEGDLTKENFTAAYKGLEKAVQQNLVRSIGVSNFNASQLERLVKQTTIKPVVNQVESSPFLPQQELLDYCTRNDIRLVAYSPLCRGRAVLFDNENLKKMASDNGKTVAQVALRYQIQRGVVVIPKSSKRNRMIENKDIFNFALKKEDLDVIKAFDVDIRLVEYEDANHLDEYPW